MSEDNNPKTAKVKVIKKRFNLKAFLVMLLAIYLIIAFVCYFLTIKIKAIIVNGNTFLSDSKIIEIASLGDDPTVFSTLFNNIKDKLMKTDLFKDVKVQHSLDGTLTISLEEESPLFYNKTNEKYVLSNNKEVVLDEPILGIPTLVNYVPEDIYNDLNKKMSKIDSDIISLISEIEYNPDIKDKITIDEYRFILRMNDGNTVYINIANFDKLQEYKRLYKTIPEGELGIFNLNVIGDTSNVVFKSYASFNEVKEEEVVKDELSN